MKLLPASVNPVDPPPAPDLSTSLAPLTQKAIATRSQISLVPSPDAFARSSSTSTRRGEPNLIYGTPVEDSQSHDAGPSRGEYISGWAWSRPAEKTAVAHYLSYAASLTAWNGRLINLYA